MALFLTISVDIYLVLFKFSVLREEFGTMVNKCILISLFVCLFVYLLLLLLLLLYLICIFDVLYIQ